MMTACLKNIVKADQITFDIAVRVRDAVTHSDLGGKVHHHINLVFLKYLIDLDFVCNATFDERPIFG